MFASFTEPFNLCSAHCITITHTVLPVPSNPFHPLMTTSFYVFLGLPLCLAPTTSKVTHFPPNHHPFLKHVYTIPLTYVSIN